MRADIAIRGVSISPNPVVTKQTFKIAVDIEDVIYVLGEDDYALADNDGALIRTE